MKALAALLVAATLYATARAQAPKSGPWEMQQSGTTASLRGIHAVGGGVAWASGTNGTVLRTEDSGYMWQSCSMPPGAEKLDFRGIWAWDADTAIVMSSGPGDQSRLYKTTDGCSHWTLLFTNPLKDGFWDALFFLDQKNGLVLGDPVKPDPDAKVVEGRLGIFPIRATSDNGWKWTPVILQSPPARNLQPLPDEAFFAASNSSVASYGDWLWIGTSRARVLRRKIRRNGQPVGFLPGGLIGQADPISGVQPIFWQDLESADAPLAHGNASSGIFSLAFRDEQHGLAVGGDYSQPNESAGTAAWTADGGQHWTAAFKPPHGYRSAVAWDADAKVWITTGTNGSDVSYDNGDTWLPLDNGNWNALSLPWVVGPKGRIAKLGALPPTNERSMPLMRLTH
jgi:photosystem II stability/assembly factor-like uncharacterized protein